MHIKGESAPARCAHHQVPSVSVNTDSQGRQERGKRERLKGEADQNCRKGSEFQEAQRQAPPQKACDRKYEIEMPLGEGNLFLVELDSSLHVSDVQKGKGNR